MRTSDQQAHGVNYLARSSSDTLSTIPIKKRRFMLARSPSPPPPPPPPDESSLLPANNDVPVPQNNLEAVPSVSEILGQSVSMTALTSKGYCEPEVERFVLARSPSPPPLPPPPPPPQPDESSLLPANNDVPVPQNSLEAVPSVSDILSQPVSRTALTSKGYCEPEVNLVREVLIQPTDHENLSRSLHQGLRPDMAGKDTRQAKEFTPEKKYSSLPVAGVTQFLSTKEPFEPPLNERHVEQKHVPTKTSMFPTDSGNMKFQLSFKDPIVNGKNSEGISMKQKKLDSGSWSLSLDAGKQNVQSKMNDCESEVEPLMDRSNWDLNTTMDSWPGLPNNSTDNRLSDWLSSVGCAQNNKPGSGLEQMPYREPAGSVAAVGKIMLRKNASSPSSPMSMNESSNPETSLDLQLKPSLMAESFFKWGSTCPLDKVDSTKETPILSLSVKSLPPGPTSCKPAPVVSRSVKAEPYEKLSQKDIGKGGNHALRSTVKHEPHEGQESPQRSCHSNQKSASSAAVKLEAREGASQEYLGKHDRLLTSQRMEMTVDTTEHAKTLESRVSDGSVLSDAIMLQDPSRTVGKVLALVTQAPTPDKKFPGGNGLSGTATSQFHKGVVTESSDLLHESLISEDQKSNLSSKSVGFAATPCKNFDTKEHVVADVKLEVVGQMCNTDSYNTSHVASTDKLTVDSFVKGKDDHNNKEKIELSATFGKPSGRESELSSSNEEAGALDVVQRRELNDSAKVLGKPSDHKRELSYSNEEAGALDNVPKSELNDSAKVLGKPSNDERVSSSSHEEVGALEAVQRSELNDSAKVLVKPSDHERELSYSNEEAGALDTVPRSELNDSAKVLGKPSNDERVSSSLHEEVGALEAVQRSELNDSAKVLGKPSDHDRELSYSNEEAGALNTIPRSELNDSAKLLGKPSDDERVSSSSHEEAGALDRVQKRELNNSHEEATVNTVHKRPREDDEYEDGEFIDYALHGTAESSCEEREGKQLKADADFICPIAVPTEVSSCTDRKEGKIETVEESKILDTENCEDSQSCHTDELGIATTTKLHDSLADGVHMADSLKKRPNKSARKMTPLQLKGKGPESKLKSNTALTSRTVTKNTHDEVSSRQMKSSTKDEAPGNEKGSSSRIIDLNLKRAPAPDGLASGRGKSFSGRPVSLRVGKERFADNLLGREKTRSQKFRDEKINYRSRVFERARNTNQQDGRHGPDLRFSSRAENQINNERNSGCEHGFEQADNSSAARYTRRFDPSEGDLLPESNGSIGNDGRVTQKFTEYGLQNRFHMSYRGRLPSRRGRIQGGNQMIHHANENVSPSSYTSREVPDFALRAHDERLTRTLPDGRMIPIGSGACPQYEHEEVNLIHRERRSRERRSLSPLICRERSLSPPIRRRGPIEFPPICLESSPRCQPRHLHQWSPPRRSSNGFNGPPELVGRSSRPDRMRPPHEHPCYFVEDVVVSRGGSPDYIARLSDDTGDVGPSRQHDFSRPGRGLQRNMRRFDTIDSRRNMQRFDTMDSQNFPEEDYFNQCGGPNGNVEFVDRNCIENLERRVLVHGRPFQQRPPNDDVNETFHPHADSGPPGPARFCHDDDNPGDYDGHVRNRLCEPGLRGRLRGIEQEDDYMYRGEPGWRDPSMGDGGVKRRRVERH